MKDSLSDSADNRKKKEKSCLPDKRAGRMLVKAVNSVIDTAVLVIFVVLLFFGLYGVWDTSDVYENADSSQYTVYKPEYRDTRGFSDFQKVNPDVFGWLDIYGTKIDYPLVQADDNEKYLNTSADGKYSMTGSLYLDYRCSQNFTDFNSIIYGHNMIGNVMFGELSDFADEEFFAEHQYGSLYFNGAYHGLEFVEYLETDAYNWDVYQPCITEDDEKQAYLQLLDSLAMHRRDTELTAQDHIVLLSTCNSDSTNGRSILVGKISDKVYDDPFPPEEANRGFADRILTGDNPAEKAFWLGGILLALALLLAAVHMISRKRKKHGETDGKTEKTD